jgi:hypothetical protein
VACFLPGQAKNLSAPPRTMDLHAVGLRGVDWIDQTCECGDDAFGVHKMWGIS